MLTDVAVSRGGGLVLTMEAGGPWQGHLVWDGPPDATLVLERLTIHIGRAIADLGDVEI